TTPTTPTGPTSPADIRSHLSGQWRLTHLNGVAVSAGSDAWLKDRFPSLSLGEGDRLAGMGGVNHWGASLDPKGLASGAFLLSPIASTKIAGPVAAAALESRFFAALEQARSFDPAQLAAGTLTLRDAAGAEVARFARAK
ncbi:MAG: META domain-containing protein, partial [Phycisphaerales bacterium]|nr:META domain-containing protein [Phycisphaerales bacterium]